MPDPKHKLYITISGEPGTGKSIAAAGAIAALQRMLPTVTICRFYEDIHTGVSEDTASVIIRETQHA